jgi:uncharacterized protein
MPQEWAPPPVWYAPHRPWPPPDTPWVMTQRWHDLMFAHWPIPEEVMRQVVPKALPIDTFEGQAWIGVVPFRMTDVRMRLMPPIPGASAFPEINVRTYTTVDGKPGVYFFSLDAANRLAVMAARAGVGLPYYWARMSCERWQERSDEMIFYESRRFRVEGIPAEFIARYRPAGEVFHAEPGTLDYFLTERYCLYTADDSGNVNRLEILHAPWPLQPAVAEISRNTMTTPIGIALPDVPPVLHFARHLEVLFWPPYPA